MPRDIKRDPACLWDMLDAAKAVVTFTSSRTFHEYQKDRMLIPSSYQTLRGRVLIFSDRILLYIAWVSPEGSIPNTKERVLRQR